MIALLSAFAGPALGFILKYWKIFSIIAAVAVVYLLWQSDRHSQYLLGVADTNAAFEKLVSRSTELKDHEKVTAHDIATSAAASVCEQAGADPRECEGL